ncbi:IS30 family transposase [Mycobacterium shinjukuense]|uniref:IS30 family transposase n=2 Tax=Mycobacterium shinjukuense TaxID=398694 RepID=UPI0021F2931A|nr:IS30 family transposase [Mycobacterium shinjukuense]
MAGKLEKGGSPEQISSWLRRTYPQRPGWHVTHETIYRGLYNAEKSGLARTLTNKLRTARPMRKRRRRPDTREVRYVIPAKPIDQRPPIVELRQRIGDGEGDTIVGRHTRSAIGTIVERRSRLVRLVHLPAGHTGEAFAAAATHLLTSIPDAARLTLTWDQGAQMARHDLLAELFAEASIPDAARLTLTWDQGAQMARHDLLAELFAEGIYFAPPASPWLRTAARNQRERQRSAPPVFPQGQRPVRAWPRRGAPRRATAQHPPAEDPRLAHPGRGLRIRTGTMKFVLCCDDRANPRLNPSAAPGSVFGCR